MPVTERRVVFAEAEERLQIQTVIVEKDFWVCWMLGRLFERPEWHDALVFKGGTALSKVFGISRPCHRSNQMMKPKLLLCLALVLSGALAGCVTHKPEEIVEQMRGFDMQPSNPMLDDGKIDSKEQHRQMIIGQFRMLGKESTPVLSHALQDSDVQMRRNAELVMIWLAGGYDGQPKMNIQEAIPALIKATEDGDSEVRAWAAHALAEIGPDAKAAVPALIKLVCDPDEGCRNDACIALGDIGPAAKDALLTLRNALNDPSKDVRQFAKTAIGKIQI